MSRRPWDWDKLKKKHEAEEEPGPVMTPSSEWGTEVGEWLFGVIWKFCKVVVVLAMISTVGFFFTLGMLVAQWAFAAL